MINFEFISPTKIFFGENQEENIGKIIKNYGFKNILFHYGTSSIFKTGLYDKVVKSLNENNINFIPLGGVTPNPKISLVREGVKIVKENNIEFILAVGGGSVIDSAKAISHGAKVDFDPWKFFTQEEKSISCLPVGVILTLSAAGSELSNSCVISNTEINVKNGFNTDLNRPLFAVMNPKLTYSVSKYQTACGIVDILMHTLERYFNDEQNTYFADEMAYGIIKSTIKAGLIAYENPEDYDARATLMIASSYSHNGLTGLGNKFYFTVHKLEHILSGLYDEVAHGAGLAILFPAWAKYTKDIFNDKWISLGKTLNINSKNEEELIDNTILYFEKLFKNINMPIRLEEVNVFEKDFDNFATRATKNNTVKVVGVKQLDKEDVLNILKLAK